MGMETNREIISVKSDRRQLITKCIFSTNDIVALFGYTKRKALKIKSLAISKYKGAVLYNKHAVTAEAVFMAIGLDRKTEIAAISPIDEKTDAS